MPDKNISIYDKELSNKNLDFLEKYGECNECGGPHHFCEECCECIDEGSDNCRNCKP